MNKLLKILFITVIVSLIFTSCSGNPTRDNSVLNDEDNAVKQANIIPTLRVYASFYSYYDFAKQIGGERADVHLIVPVGAEPHSFELSPRQIARMQEADVLIYNGMGLEPWADKLISVIDNNDVKIIEGSHGLELLKIREDSEHGHDYGHSDGKKEGEYDPHVWLDPLKAVKISEKIMNAYIESDQENKGYYKDNFNRFRKRLEKLHKDMEEGLKNVQQRKILVSHSAFGYLANRYNIEEISVAGLSPHEEPSPARLAELIKQAKKYNIEYIFFEGLATSRTAEILAKEAGLDTLILYNMEGMTQDLIDAGEDYISLMYANLENLKKALVN